MNHSSNSVSASAIARDVTAGLVVFLVAVPLCLGIALASNAPLLSGVLTGIIGGILVGMISQSHTSVSGPAAALAAVVATEIATLGSFAAFQVAVILAGAIQLALGFARAGSVAAFFPSSVIKGLLAAIGVLLILKQVPHLLGHDADPQGDMAFHQPNDANTFTELHHMFGHIHPGAAIIGIGSIVLLIAWARYDALNKSGFPASLAVVVFGVALSSLFQQIGGAWIVEPSNFVRLPIITGVTGFTSLFQAPDLSQLSNPNVYLAGLTIALAASLGTLLNLQSVDKLDPLQRKSPPSRELIAQGVGNMIAGMIGGLPMTSEIIRGSVNVSAGSRSKLATIVHGAMLLTSILLFPQWINMIPLSCLAAILLVTGVKLASPQLFKHMWDEGRYQFLPFVLTVAAIVFTDLLRGVLIGLVVSLGFILNSNLRRPIRRFIEKHLGGDVLHVELANQVSFLNRAALSRVLDEVPAGGHVLLDAQNTDYIDPDVLDLIRDYNEQTAPARHVQVSMIGFRSKYQLRDQVQYLDYSTRELQSQLTPAMVLQILKDGHERFSKGERLTRDLGRQIKATASKQHPLAVVLSCIDSRAPTELIFDLGLGDILSIRVAGNILTREILGSMEYACAVAEAKLILVMGHTRCGAVTAAVELAGSKKTVAEATGCQNLEPILQAIQASFDSATRTGLASEDKERFVNTIARGNVVRVTELILKESETLRELHARGRIGMMGAVYDVISGEIEFIPHADHCTA